MATQAKTASAISDLIIINNDRYEGYKTVHKAKALPVNYANLYRPGKTSPSATKQKTQENCTGPGWISKQP